MNIERWQQVEQVLSAALGLSASERQAFIEHECDGDSALRLEVESLLAHQRPAEDFIESSAFPLAAILLADKAAKPDSEQWNGRLIGAYRVVREIGRGGMGTVFLAVREGVEFHQQVALKVVSLSFAHPELTRRFHSERRILASLTHVNIAHLIDAGVSETGDPYLAMEYVEGIRIDEYCRQENLTLEARLKLFLAVCKGVASAHQHLVVHRDLKPSNILVGKDGAPKLLDFGIAKLLDDDPSIENTRTGLRAFTLEYASPEQLRGDAVTTASDIYSLGVLLYQLLTNRRPHNFKSGSADEIERFLNSSPPRLNSGSSETGDESHINISKASLSGDLENIVFKALMKERERRYSSVEQLATDIELYLAGRPVLARPNTFSYRTIKFVRRNRAAVVAAALVMISLVVGLGFSLYQYRRASQERTRIATVNDYLEKLLFSKYPAGLKVAPTSNKELDDVLDVAARELAQSDLSSDPVLKAQLEFLVGRTYLAQGRYVEAEKFLRDALAIRTSLYDESSAETLEVWQQLAMLLLAKADYEQAEQVYRKILPLMRDATRTRKISPSMLLVGLNDFGVLRRAKGDSKEAEQIFREAINLAKTVPAQSLSSNGTTKTVLVLTLVDQGKFAEAETLARQLVTEFSETNEKETPEMCASLTILGSVLLEQNSLDEAEQKLREAETIYRKLYSPNFMATHDNLRLQAQVRLQQGRLTEAETLIDSVLDNYQKNSNPRYINYATALTIKGMILNKEGKSGEAEKILREALEIRKSNLPAQHFMLALTAGVLGEYLVTQKKYAEAEPLLQLSYNSLVLSQTPDNPRILLARKRLQELEAARKQQQ